MTRRLLGLMCVRNEADQLLTRSITWHLRFLDGLFVFDDQSTDASPIEAAKSGAVTTVRDSEQPSFLEHEGRFRQASWDAFEKAMQPKPNDWVLVVDADQFFVANGSERNELVLIAARAESGGYNAAMIKVIEIFDVVDGVPYQRIDGWWDQITVPHYFRYEPDGRIRDKPMGCGSAPTYVQPMPGYAATSQLLHYGYATETRRIAKHRRYSTIVNNGHNPIHIDSILGERTVTPWTGKSPP